MRCTTSGSAACTAIGNASVSTAAHHCGRGRQNPGSAVAAKPALGCRCRWCRRRLAWPMRCPWRQRRQARRRSWPRQTTRRRTPRTTRGCGAQGRRACFGAQPPATPSPAAGVGLLHGGRPAAHLAEPKAVPACRIRQSTACIKRQLCCVAVLGGRRTFGVRQFARGRAVPFALQGSVLFFTACSQADGSLRLPLHTAPNRCDGG